MNQQTYYETGQLIMRGATENKGSAEKPFNVRDFVIEQATNNPQYPNYLRFQLKGDRCDLIDDFKRNDTVTVFFDIEGRKYTPNNGGETRFFTNLSAWKVLAGTHTHAAGGGNASSQMPQATDERGTATAAKQADPEPAVDDDLPF